MNLTILAGNVLYPILLRWFIIFLSSIVRKRSNRKVYLRYLLLNGRHLYSSLFGSQQTWLLLIQQGLLIFTQIFMTMVLSSSYDPSFENALFRSVNARHAGFSVAPMSAMNSGVLIMILSFMYLAPAPYISMLKSSDLHFAGQDSFHSAADGDDYFGSFVKDDNGNENDAHDNENDAHDNKEGTSIVRFEGDTPPPSLSAKSRKLSIKMARDNKSMQQQASQSLYRRSQFSLGRGTLRRRRSAMYDEEMIDTRLLLLTMYGDGQPVPLKIRVGLRARAVLFQARVMGGSFMNSVKPDIYFLFFAWWFICACENFQVTFDVTIPSTNTTVPVSNANKVFDTLFEVVSSFGNVGLTMGEEKPGSVAAFAADLGGFSILMLVVVQFAGKLRLFPNMTDSALSVIMPIDADEVLSDEWMKKAVSRDEGSDYSFDLGLCDPEEEEEEEEEEGCEEAAARGTVVSEDEEFREAPSMSVSFAEPSRGGLKRDWKRDPADNTIPLLSNSSSNNNNANRV